MSPAPQFNGSNDQSIMIVPPAYQPLTGLAFQCMVCNEIFDDPTRRLEHMSSKHGELCGNGFDCDSDDEISDDLTRLLEPICEIKLIGEDDGDQCSNAGNQHLSNVPVNSFGNNGQVTGEQLGLQIGLHVQMQLQLALQQHLMQAQMNGTRQFIQPPPPQLQPQPQIQPQLQIQNLQSQSQPQLQPIPNQNVQMQTTKGAQSQPAPLSTSKIEAQHLFDLVAKYLMCSYFPIV